MARLCAGSVEISRTDLRTLANWMASEQEVVVLPTPPPNGSIQDLLATGDGQGEDPMAGLGMGNMMQDLAFITKS
jgi:hypothetical protein